MSDCKTWTGEALEGGIQSVIRDIKDASNHINFIRKAVVELNDAGDAEAGMGLLCAVEVALDNLAGDAEDNIKHVLELDAVAAKESSFLIRGHGEHQLFDALQEGRQVGGFCVEFMARAARKALEVYRADHQMPKEPIPDESVVNAVVEAVLEDQTPERAMEGADHE
jgi:hypothetical protein